MSKLVWDEAIDAVKEISGPNLRAGLYKAALDGVLLEAACEAVRAEIERRLNEAPPPEVEAFSWVAPDGELQVRVKAVSPAETFPPSRPDKKRRYWLIEIPGDNGGALTPMDADKGGCEERNYPMEEWLREQMAPRLEEIARKGREFARRAQAAIWEKVKALGKGAMSKERKDGEGGE